MQSIPYVTKVTRVDGHTIHRFILEHIGRQKTSPPSLATISWLNHQWRLVIRFFSRSFVCICVQCKFIRYVALYVWLKCWCKNGVGEKICFFIEACFVIGTHECTTVHRLSYWETSWGVEILTIDPTYIVWPTDHITLVIQTSGEIYCLFISVGLFI